MIILLTGNKESRKEAVQNICHEQGIALKHVQHFYVDDFEETAFENRIPMNTGLFGERECFIIHDATRKLPLATLLKKYSETEHILIFSEDSVLKKDLGSFQKINAQIQAFAEEEKNEEKKYHIFDLADFLGAKDRKNLWLGFQEARAKASAEEIHGVLFWELKTLALIKKGDTQKMSFRVLRKNEVFAQQWTLEEIQKLANRMTYLFHNRDTYSTLSIELEKMILDL